MKKKTLSLALALVMCLGLTVPAFAADTKSAEPVECFTLTGVVSEEMQPASPVGIMLYKMEFPATLVFSGLGQLDDSGYLRRVELLANIYGAAQNGPEEPADWNFEEKGPYIPGEWVRTGQIAELKRTEDGVYTFDESFAGKCVFLEMCEGWGNATESSGDSAQPTTSGWTEVLLQFPDAGDTQPEQPTAPVQPEQPGKTEIAMPTNDALTVNGVLQTPTVYKINDSNYFKIRDLAAILNGTSKQFSVGYDSELKSVTATTGEGYEKQEGDLAGAPAGGEKTAEPSNDTIYINGEKVEVEVYKIDGSNYFKLRDLGKALGFHVDWTAEQGVYIETK